VEEVEQVLPHYFTATRRLTFVLLPLECICSGRAHCGGEDEHEFARLLEQRRVECDSVVTKIDEVVHTFVGFFENRPKLGAEFVW